MRKTLKYGTPVLPVLDTEEAFQELTDSFESRRCSQTLSPYRPEAEI